MLLPLDLYNDSADCALNRFHKQYLYDEIEAEVRDSRLYLLSIIKKLSIMPSQGLLHTLRYYLLSYTNVDV